MADPPAVDPVADIAAYAVPYTETNDHRSTRWALLVRVATGTGAVGWGEGATIVAEAAQASALLARAYGPVLAGSPAEPAAAGRLMARHGWWHGGAGIDSFAVSAIDQALWRLVAQRSGRSLSQELAARTGRAPQQLPRLLSVHATEADLERSADQLVTAAVDRGCVGLKVAFGKAGQAGLGRDPARDLRFVAALRARATPDFALMVDVAPTLGWTLPDVRERAAGLLELGVAWLEEPLGDRDPAGYAQLKAEHPRLRLAYGEREWSPRGVGEIIATGAVDVVGMDPGRVRGVSGFLDGAQQCAEARVWANAHAFAGPLIRDAAEAVAAVSPACRYFEVAPSRNDLFDLVDEDGVVDEQAVRARSRG